MIMGCVRCQMEALVGKKSSACEAGCYYDTLLHWLYRIKGPADEIKMQQKAF